MLERCTRLALALDDTEDSEAEHQLWKASKRSRWSEDVGGGIYDRCLKRQEGVEKRVMREKLILERAVLGSYLSNQG